MARAIQDQREAPLVNMKRTKEGRIQKKNDEPAKGIPIEIKKYKVTELSALNGKFKKISTKLEIEEETNEGRSIMMNMKTSTFEVMKQHLLNLLVKHEALQNVNLVRTSKATTEHAKEADMEYHIDLDLVINEKVHNLKLKCFNSNCRIQVQHIGKGPHQPQSHLKGKSPPKYFAEEILFPIGKSINDDINEAKEK